MAFNGSGVHNRVHDWTQDLTNTIPVTASRMDAEHDDMSTALSNTICRDGQSITSARIPFASGTSAAAGSTSAVSYAQTNDLNTGLYFPATDQWGLVAGGTATLTGTAAGVAGAAVATQAQMESASDATVLVTAGRTQFHPGVAKGWVQADAAGNINGSHNVSSISDAGQGVLITSWGADFSNDDYAVGGSAGISTGARIFTPQAFATSAVQIASFNTSAGAADPDLYSVVGFGDQA